MLPDCDHIYATDHRWWAYHIGDITKDFEGECWTQDILWPTTKDKETGELLESPQAWNIHCLTADTSAHGLARDKDKIHTGKNSGYAAIGLAYHLGAERIILIGYDMMLDGDTRHWFGNHPDKLNVASSYPDFIKMFRTIDPAEYGIEIWNCSRRTALDHFPTYNLDEIYEGFNRPDH